MSASPPKADMCGATNDVGYGLIADIVNYSELAGQLLACFFFFGLSETPSAPFTPPDATYGAANNGANCAAHPACRLAHFSSSLACAFLRAANNTLRAGNHRHGQESANDYSQPPYFHVCSANIKARLKSGRLAEIDLEL